MNEDQKKQLKELLDKISISGSYDAAKIAVNVRQLSAEFKKSATETQRAGANNPKNVTPNASAKKL